MATITLPGVLLSGTHASRPAASAVANGALYAETDTGQTFQSDGSSTWTAWGAVASGLAKGTSFPGSPSTNDMYFRTDRGLLYYYDGTRWLTVTLYDRPIAKSSLLIPISGATLDVSPSWGSDYDMWLLDFRVLMFAGSINGGNYWTVTLEKRNAANAATTITTVNDSADTAANWVVHKSAVNALLAGATYPDIGANVVATGSPGPLYYEPHITYRLVG